MAVFESRIIKIKPTPAATRLKRMIVYAPEKTITRVKLRAMCEDISISKWILEAIEEKICKGKNGQ
jgi:hypothetical protein